MYVAGAYPKAMSNERERVISITLSEAEWQAFIARQPPHRVCLISRTWLPASL